MEGPVVHDHHSILIPSRLLWNGFALTSMFMSNLDDSLSSMILGMQHCRSNGPISIVDSFVAKLLIGGKDYGSAHASGQDLNALNTDKRGPDAFQIGRKHTNQSLLVEWIPRGSDPSNSRRPILFCKGGQTFSSGFGILISGN